MTDEYCSHSGIKLDKKPKKLKEFNLERALAGDPVVTRDRRKVIEIIALKRRKRNSIVAVLEDIINDDNSDFDRISITCIEGRSCGGSEYDLFMAPIKKKYYVNVYSCKMDNQLGSCISTDKNFDSTLYTLLKTIKFEVEE